MHKPHHRDLLPILAALVVGLSFASAAHAQLTTGYLGDEPGPKSWTIDVTTGEFTTGGGAISRAAAYDQERGFGVSVGDPRRSTDPVKLYGCPACPLDVRSPGGSPYFRVTALAAGGGAVYGYGRGVGTQNRLGTIDIDTGVFTLLFTEDEIGGDVTGLTYDHDRDELLVAIENSVYVFDVETGETEFVTSGPGDGLAYGYNRIYMVCGFGNTCPDIAVYNRITESYEPGIPVPPRNGNGASSAAFEEDRAVAPPLCDDPSCPSATNKVLLSKTDSALQLTWESECVGGMAYDAPEEAASAVYRGDLRAGYLSLGAEPGQCGIAGQSAEIPLGNGDADFFLVVPHDGLTEGSYGRTSNSAERTQATGACFPQNVDSCVNVGG